MRQLTRELRERRAAAEALRRDLRAQGQETGDLDRLIDEMRSVERQGSFDLSTDIEQLQSSVVDGLKAFEFALRRQLSGDGAQPVLGGNADVPASYRQLVDEYYKALAKKPR
jgi:hypothetical protein